MKNKADYSTTIIYKITCNDPNTTDKYVGHTTDLVRRRQGHKNSTCNVKSANYNLKLYKFIREHGGWGNWKMEIIAYYNCNNLNEAKQKEQEHYNELNASLNSIEPSKLKQIKIKDEVETSSDKLECKECHFTCFNLLNWNNHILTKNHNNRLNTISEKIKKQTIKQTEIKYKYKCESCEYLCYNKTNFDKHLATRKHNNNGKCLQNNEYSCNCGKIYKHRQSLSTHKKSCAQTESTIEIVVLTNEVANEVAVDKK